LATTSLVSLALAAGAPTSALAQCLSTYSNVTVAGCTNAGTLSQLTFTNSSISSSVLNTGTISPGGFSLINSTLFGGFQDTGTITGGILIDAQSSVLGGVSGLNINSTPTFGGGIVNAGVLTPAGGQFGIFVDNLSVFTGGIVNSGTILANSISAGKGIAIDIGQFNPVSTFAGGISNSGTISAGVTGISVANVSLFSGSIGNSGSLSSITGDAILVSGVGSFTGSIANAGTLNANAGKGVLVTGVSSFSGGISSSGAINAGQAGVEVGTFGGALVSTFLGGIVNSGTITSANGDGVLVTGFGSASLMPSFGGGIANTGIINGNTNGINLQFVSNFSGGIANTGTIALASTVGPITTPGINVAGVSTFAGGITNSGTITALGPVGSGILVAGVAAAGNAVSTFTGGITNSGTINATQFGIGIGGATISSFGGGITNSGSITASTGINFGAQIATFSGAITNSGNITGTGGNAIDVHSAQSAITINQNAGTITGAIKLSSHGDVLNVSGGAIAGNIVGLGTTDAINFALGPNIFTYGAAYNFSGINQLNVNSGTVILNGANSATNIAVSGGNLQVGDAANTAATLTGTVGVTGGTLSGHGTVIGGVSIGNGGTLAPGGSIGTLTIQGNLALAAAASYMVEISAAGSSSTGVTGTATLGGTVQVTSPTHTFRFNSPYTILTSGGRGGTQFDGLVLPSGMTGSLIYPNANDVQLTLTSNLRQLAGMNVNQRNVATALDTAFTAAGQTGALGGIFLGNTQQNLTQASGEPATGSQQTTFDAMNLFMGVLTDPFIAGRGDPVTPAGGAPGFADEDHGASAYASKGKPRSAAERDAYAAVYRKAPVTADAFARRWSVWAAGFGGSQTTDGNAALGSNTVTSRIAGAAVGADYRFSPYTIAGFALAGGGTNFSLANALGGGRSDLFQAGVFIRHTVGPAYLSGALAYGWQDVTTDRTVTIAGVDQLRARFNANAFSGRAEGGYRFLTPWMGVTPYAAGQFTTFDLPAYSEQAISGANTFALSYGAKNVTASRSELGLRADRSFAVQDAVLTLRGRFAWAHDFNTGRNIAATFQTLPTASFVVNGATLAQDAALTTASAEFNWLNGWSAAATFEGEFSDVTRSYAGKGVVRYAW
jgi:uncharacterized protein with beta-barrel porin domain